MEAHKQEFTWPIEDFSNIPEISGVYLFYDSRDNVLYVGKAKNLRNRLKSYASVDPTLYPKTYSLVEKAHKVRLFFTPSEIDAFLLEQRLIRTLKPPYNVKLKDDSNYPYIVIEDVKVSEKEQYKRVYVSRNYKPDEKRVYIGPYVEANELKQVLRILRKIFPFADCSKTKFLSYRKLKRPCLYGQIGVCPAPCQDSKMIEMLEKNIKKLVYFLEKGQIETMRRLEKKMREYIKAEKFEKAKEIRDQLVAVNSLYNVGLLQPELLDEGVLPEDIYRKRVEDIISFFGLSIDSWEHFRVECYDISNLMGKYAVGSMVVSVGGKLRKDLYRRFKVKTVFQISDVDMMQEVIKRRVKRVKDWGVPNMILIDGGKTQLNAVYKIIKQFDLFKAVFIASIVKPNDDFYIIKNNRPYLLKVTERTLGIQHLRELRDEAHKFAKRYFRKLYEKLEN